MTQRDQSNIERRVALIEDDGSLGEDFALVRVSEDTFEIETLEGRTVFRAPLAVLVLQLCLLEPKLSEFLL